MDDKPIMKQRMFAGVRLSGMLDEYFNALGNLESINSEIKKRVEQIKRTTSDPNRRMGSQQDVKRHVDYEINTLEQFVAGPEKQLLQNLQVRKDSIFIDNELHTYIDSVIEYRLKLLQKK